MELKIETVIKLELDTTQAGALMVILNGFRSLEVNDKDFFDEYSISNKEEESIDELSKKLNSVSTFLI